MVKMRVVCLVVGVLFLLSVLPGCFYSEASKAEKIKEVVLEVGKAEGWSGLAKALVDADAANRFGALAERGAGGLRIEAERLRDAVRAVGPRGEGYVDALRGTVLLEKAAYLHEKEAQWFYALASKLREGGCVTGEQNGLWPTLQRSRRQYLKTLLDYQRIQSEKRVYSAALKTIGAKHSASTRLLTGWKSLRKLYRRKLTFPFGFEFELV